MESPTPNPAPQEEETAPPPPAEAPPAEAPTEAAEAAEAPPAIRQDVVYSANGLFDGYLPFAKSYKGGLYAPQPQVSPSALAQEVQDAQDEFQAMIQSEEERVKALAMEENERVMDLLRKEEEVLICPICIEEVNAVCKWYEDPGILACCGTRICPSCEKGWRRNGGFQCFVCRFKGGHSGKGTEKEGIANVQKLAIKGCRYGRGWAYSQLGDDYKYGRNGKRRKIKKVFELFTKATEFGSPAALCELAEAYYIGHFHEMPLQQSTEKALELVTESYNQGYPNAYTILGDILLENEFSITSESYRLWSIGAYQGNTRSMMKLEHANARRYDLLKAIDNKRPDQSLEKRQCAIRALYWSLKASEERENESLRKANLYMSAQHMDLVVRLWHPRNFFDLETLPGYSHVPFCTFALKKGMSEEKLKPLKFIGTWKLICANCGKVGKDDNVNLRACAECKAFSYCSKECQVKHWKAGHKVDCKAHWIEQYFPNIRKLTISYSLRK